MFNRKFFLKFMSVLFCLALIATPVAAQSNFTGRFSIQGDTPSLPPVDPANELTFSQLGKSEQYLKCSADCCRQSHLLQFIDIKLQSDHE